MDRYAGAFQYEQPDFTFTAKLAESIGKNTVYTGSYFHKVSNSMQVLSPATCPRPTPIHRHASPLSLRRVSLCGLARCKALAPFHASALATTRWVASSPRHLTRSPSTSLLAACTSLTKTRRCVRGVYHGSCVFYVLACYGA